MPTNVSSNNERRNRKNLCEWNLNRNPNVGSRWNFFSVETFQQTNVHRSPNIEHRTSNILIHTNKCDIYYYVELSNANALNLHATKLNHCNCNHIHSIYIHFLFCSPYIITSKNEANAACAFALIWTLLPSLSLCLSITLLACLSLWLHVSLHICHCYKTFVAVNAIKCIDSIGKHPNSNS